MDLKKDEFLRFEKDNKKGFIYSWPQDTHTLTINTSTITAQHNRKSGLKTHIQGKDSLQQLQIRKKPYPGVV